MNDRRIASYFRREREEGRIIVARCGEQMLVSGGFFALAVPPDHPIFGSRRLFPELPEDGRTCLFMADSIPPPKQKTDLVAIWKEHADLDKWQPIKLTPWLYAHPDYTARTFVLMPEKQRTIINVNFIDLLVGRSESLSDYSYYSRLSKKKRGIPRAGSQPLLAVRDNTLVGVFMPIWVSPNQMQFDWVIEEAMPEREVPA